MWRVPWLHDILSATSSGTAGRIQVQTWFGPIPLMKLTPYNWHRHTGNLISSFCCLRAFGQSKPIVCFMQIAPPIVGVREQHAEQKKNPEFPGSQYVWSWAPEPNPGIFTMKCHDWRNHTNHSDNHPCRNMTSLSCMYCVFLSSLTHVHSHF